MSLKKNIRIAVAIVPLLAFSMMVNSVADAAVATDGKTATTSANLTLLEKSGPVDPLDPSKPVQPINPVKPTTGDLRIDYISSFHFGSQDISGSNQTYYATFDRVADMTNRRDPTGVWDTSQLTDKDYYNVPNYAQVTNNTTGNWSLGVSNTTFKNAHGDELKGAILNIKNLEAHSETPGFQIDNDLGFAKLSGDGDTSMIVFRTDGNSDNPSGTWTIAMGNDQAGINPTGNNAVSLFVPGSTVKTKEAYTSTLKWTLTDTPQS